MAYRIILAGIVYHAAANRRKAVQPQHRQHGHTDPNTHVLLGYAPHNIDRIDKPDYLRGVFLRALAAIHDCAEITVIRIGPCLFRRSRSPKFL